MIELIVGGVILIFGFVVFFGAPYLPTFNKVQNTALDLLDLKPGQTLIELGSGDGRVMREAAKRKLNVVGYELNPILVIISFFATIKYRRQIKIVWGNYWRRKWPKADGIYVFLVGPYMKKLDKKIKKEFPEGILVASNSFDIPAKKPKKKKGSVYLYKY